MKKIFLLTFAMLLCSVAFNLCVLGFNNSKLNSNDILLNEVEALAVPAESSFVIICRCQDGVLTNDKCLSSNDDDICAQSQAGGNINCREYNSNC